MKKIILLAIILYKKIFSLDSGFLRFALSPLKLLTTPSVCRFTPSCSEYCYQAVKKYGIISGLLLGAKRLLSCHPYSSGGYDPLI